MNVMRLLFGGRRAHAGRKRTLISKPPPHVQWRSVRPRENARPVRAMVAEKNATVGADSGKLRVRGGEDVIVIDGDNRAVVRLDIFERTYEPLGGGLYRKRDDVVLRYFTLDRAAMIETLEGPQLAEAGDWIMQGVTGELWPVSRERAVEKYQPA